MKAFVKNNSKFKLNTIFVIMVLSISTSNSQAGIKNTLQRTLIKIKNGGGLTEKSHAKMNADLQAHESARSAKKEAADAAVGKKAFAEFAKTPAGQGYKKQNDEALANYERLKADHAKGAKAQSEDSSSAVDSESEKASKKNELLNKTVDRQMQASEHISKAQSAIKNGDLDAARYHVAQGTGHLLKGKSSADAVKADNAAIRGEDPAIVKQHLDNSEAANSAGDEAESIANRIKPKSIQPSVKGNGADVSDFDPLNK